MIFIILSALLIGNGYQFQSKYDYCKAKEFESKYCELEKKLSELK